MSAQINASSLPVLSLSHAQTNPKLFCVPGECSRKESFIYVLQRELTLLQTDGSCSSLTLGMTIHGLVYALKVGWTEVVYEARVCWELYLTLGDGSRGPKPWLCVPWGALCSQSGTESRQKFYSSNVPQIQPMRGDKSNHRELLDKGENWCFPFVNEGFRGKTTNFVSIVPPRPLLPGSANGLNSFV